MDGMAEHQANVRRSVFKAAISVALASIRDDRRSYPRSELEETGAIGERHGPEAANSIADDFLNGSDERFNDMFRMGQPCFRSLVNWLKAHTDLENGRFLTADVKVMIFLAICAQNDSKRVAAHRFHVSQGTVSSTVQQMLPRFRKLHRKYVRPQPDDWIDHVYESDPKSAYFSGCIGAIDSTHIFARIPIDQQKRWRNRKGHISQNV